MEEPKIYYKPFEVWENPEKVTCWLPNGEDYVTVLTPRTCNEYFVHKMDYIIRKNSGNILLYEINRALHAMFCDYCKRYKGAGKEAVKEWLINTRLLADECMAKNYILPWCNELEQKVFTEQSQQQDNPQPEAAEEANEAANNEQQEQAHEPNNETEKTQQEMFSKFVIRKDIEAVLWRVLDGIVKENLEEHPTEALKAIAAAEYRGYTKRLKPKNIQQIFGDFKQTTCSAYSKESILNKKSGLCVLEESAKIIDGRIEAAQKGKAEP